MFEKIVRNIEELNSVAVHLRNTKNLTELRTLAEEWLIPKKDIEDFIAGKRFRLAEIKIEEKEFKTAEQKLREEMWTLKDKEFADILAQHLIGKCEEELFSIQVLQPHKTLQKCLDYVMQQAYHVAEEKRKELDKEKGQNVGLALSHVKVYEWAEAYYALDDAAKEKKEKEERKKELQKKQKQSKLIAADQQAGINKNSGSVSGKSKVPEDDNQLTLFSMLNDGTDVTQEEKHEGV